MNDNELLTTEEVAELLQVSEESVRNYRKLTENPIPFIKIGASVRFNRASVMRWLAGREIKGGART